MTGHRPDPDDDVTPAPAGLTILESIEHLRAEGFGGDFFVREEGVACGRCGHSHGVDELHVVSVLRVEGASDPADEAIVIGLQCSACDTRGVLVAGYGPTADPGEAAVVRQLDA